MLHIVFQEADIIALQKSFELDEGLIGEIIPIKDDFAVGPLDDIYSASGIEARKQWWREVLAGGDYDGHVDQGEVDDQKAVEEIKTKLNDDPTEVVWVWAAPNKHDVSGYYWLVSQLKAYPGRIFSLYLNNLPFLNEKGQLFYPVSLFEIPAREFVKAKRLAREITLSEFEVDPDEWARICNEHRGVRLLEGGKKLAQEDYNFYDKGLASFITPDWQKASKVIQHYLSRSKHPTGDAYLLWRLKVMIAQENFETQGNIGKMKDFEIKATNSSAPAP